MTRVAKGDAAVAALVWAFPTDRLGGFLAAIPAPLGPGPVHVEDGGQALAFLAEAAACADAPDITAFGGWRAWTARAAQAS